MGMIQRMPWGVEKEGRNTSRRTPLPKKGLGAPSYGTFSIPFGCRCSFFPVQTQDRADQKLFRRGSEIFLEGALSGASSSPIRVATPSLIMAQMMLKRRPCQGEATLASRPKFFTKYLFTYSKNGPQKRGSKFASPFGGHFLWAPQTRGETATGQKSLRKQGISAIFLPCRQDLCFRQRKCYIPPIF